MSVEFDKKDLAKYPFLKEAQNLVSERAYSLDSLLNSKSGALIAKKASDRVKDALNSNFVFEEIRLDFPEGEILSYAIARIIVSCMKERQITDRLCRYESERATFFLQTEKQDNKKYIAETLGLDLDAEKIPVAKYVELTAHLRSSKWQLVNRDLDSGCVYIHKDESEELLKERIKSVLQSQLPLPVTDDICKMLEIFITGISTAYQEKVLEQFGDIDEGSFPPCMKAIIQAVTTGTNIPHTARFSLTAFMHTIGMDINQIVEVYTRAPDFDVEKTMYQVEHISGRGGTEYTPPECATMKTYGLCVNQDQICKNKNINHPLSYYKFKKKKAGYNKKENSSSKKSDENKETG
ncbi:DNA primase large subunit PriL [Methanoplanus sp. FWC-SCC4]|uniref:DNA primase large subunit PriL n=1 Tax=Methanochimaera problematica TaxID=2609417 RepID=A0AA97FDH7_9EURY|nr:DNA primase large subunit PriL [Methanoplanus sp. FWC-SCC4]WOF16248.1 DNA primase large subunit PriL [Methanoplanus sp. FWC-SCC4]